MFSHLSPIVHIVRRSLVAIFLAGVILASAEAAHAQAQGADPQPATGVGAAAADIIGGREAKPGAWPWQVALVNALSTDNYYGQFCGGSLIAPDWVLTAAHCVDGANTSFVDVVANAHYLRDPANRRLRAAKIIVHPGFDPIALDNDVAIIQLSTPVSPAVPIQLYGLPADGRSSELDFLRATVTGWGADGLSDVLSYPDALQELGLPLVDLTTCRAAYGDLSYGTLITERMLCAGYATLTKGACYGDSGGPLMVQDETGQWLQIGIVSSGPYACLSYDAYDVFTRVASHRDWIQKCVNNPDSLPCNGADQFEPDDDAMNASEYTQLGKVETHTFHVPGDQDWLKIQVEEGKLYTFQTAHILTATSGVDSVLWLYAADGHTPLAFSDSSPWMRLPWATAAGLPGFAVRSRMAQGAPGGAEIVEDVRLEWRADRTGPIYVSVEPLPAVFVPSYGAGARYMVYIDEFEQLFLPSILTTW